MSETGIVTIVVAMIVAITPALLARATLVKVDKVADKMAATRELLTDKSNQIIAQNEKLGAQNEKLEALANGTHHALTSELSTANARIEGLERLVASMMAATAATVAAATAAATVAAKKGD